MKAFSSYVVFAVLLLMLAGCASSPEKIEANSPIGIKTGETPHPQFSDARDESHRRGREISEGAESHILLADNAFAPSLSESISRLLYTELAELEPKSVRLTKAYVGAVKITPGRSGSGYRGTPYIPPGTHPAAAALGVLLGEGLIYLAESAKASSKAREAWSAELAVEVDGDPIYTINRRARAPDTNAATVLPELVQMAAKDIAEKYRLRVEKLKSEVVTPK